VAIAAQVALGSLAGVATAARYLLATLPLVVIICVSTVWRRVRQWPVILGIVAAGFVLAWFINPPYPFALEDNLAYRDYIVLHAEASRFLTMRDPNARVLTAWPASDELTRPWLGYVTQPFRAVRIEDFTAAQIALASQQRGQFDVALVFSTKYEPPHALLENWAAWERTKEKFFGYHRDLVPDEIARRLGGRILFYKEENGQWVAVIAVEKEENAQLQRLAVPDRHLPDRF